jgi:hypothetical protein
VIKGFRNILNEIAGGAFSRDEKNKNKRDRQLSFFACLGIGATPQK